MPRQESTSWVPNDPITAARLEDFNQDIDDIYATGSDHLKVYRLTGHPAMQVTIGPGTYMVGSAEGNYAGGTLTVASSVTTYIMINSAGSIVTSTSGWDGQNARLAVVVSGVSSITSITDWRNKVVGGDFGGNPTGTILIWSTNTSPTGYIICDGSAISRTTYAGLFGVIGTTYGVGDGSTTFNLPNLKGRVVVGRDTGQTEFDVIGETGGAKTHTLAETEIPSHRHGLDGVNTSGSNTSRIGAGDLAGATARYTQYTGGGQAHNNLQPYLVLNYIIKT